VTHSVRSRLDREAVVTVAERLVEQHGWSALTMTALATELGIKGPSLYNHVAGLDALLGELQVRAMGELGDRLQQAAMGKVGDDALRAIAQAHRRFAEEFPARYDLMMREPYDRDRLFQASSRAAAAFTAIIETFGIDEPTPELSMSCVATIHGVLVLERAGLYVDVDVDAVYDRAVTMIVELLEREGRQTTNNCI